MSKYKYTMAKFECDECHKEKHVQVDLDDTGMMNAPIGWHFFDVSHEKKVSTGSTHSERVKVVACSNRCALKRMERITGAPEPRNKKKAEG